MVFEDLGRVWREEPTGALKRRKVEDLSDAMRRADTFLSKLHRGGRRTFLLTGVLVVPIFTWGVVNAPRPELAVPGVALLMIWLTTLFLRWRNLRPPPPDTARPVREAVQSEVDRLRFLEDFWGNVSWGGIAMYLVGETLAFEGFRPVGAERTLFTFAFYAGLIAIAAVIVFRNPVIARHKVRPMREDLEGWLEGLQALERNDPTALGPHGEHA